MDYSNNDNLLIQGYFTTALLVELKNANFLNSEYYKSRQFQDKFVQDNLPTVGIDNQGALLMVLYMLLVVPRQLLETKFPTEFHSINDDVEKLAASTTSSYKKDAQGVDHVRHLRNAVSHARVNFTQDGTVTFRDEDGQGSIWEATFPLSNIGHLLTSLQVIFMKYVESVKGGFRA
ncbi:protein of unknown function [Sterolibacterium denitrificans]|uniref:pEK499-p136 HEPN domain-containing protein n=1 Tax=Sterolibacterium denitrificans TaxID=157592 RepID=A0A7Z7MV46_9PROT|nr:hypothetical protein [Sterolibacterium denitrificans]SMB25788.1 protein of unknown function [Sterolibacterium denitrificans]